MAHTNKGPSTVQQLATGQSAQLRSLEGPPLLVTRLRELGFIPGEVIVVQGRTLFGDPVLVQVRGTVVALRRQEAECLWL